MPVLTRLALLALLFATPAFAQTAEQNAEKPLPKLVSKVAYSCPPEGTSTTLSIETGMRSFTVRALVWGDGLSQMRRERQYTINREAPATERRFALLELCEIGKACRPLSGRVEFETSGFGVGVPVAGRLHWFDPNLDKNVSLPFSADIAPRDGSCG